MEGTRLETHAAGALEALEALEDFRSPSRKPARIQLVFWERHQEDNDHIFPTPESWQWFWRRNRQELVDAGAIVMVAGRILVEPKAFEATLTAIGGRQLGKRGAAAAPG